MERHAEMIWEPKFTNDCREQKVQTKEWTDNLHEWTSLSNNAAQVMRENRDHIVRVDRPLK